MVEVGTARQERDELFAGIDQILILIRLARCRAHADHAILAMQNNFALAADMVGHHGRHADAEIDVGAIRQVMRDALRHVSPAQALGYLRPNFLDIRHYAASLMALLATTMR